ncbi:hypothetical protein KSS87_022656 [Heliosperma pusillum]|nr:hypothetical protein KSS87_022656 [Heliosperma pusillum]
MEWAKNEKASKEEHQSDKIVAKMTSLGNMHQFHRDLPPTDVFAYGTTKRHASIPGPTIEALHGIDTFISWRNYLPSKHILPWDPTIPTAIPPNHEGVPTVVHLHGGIDEPESDGHGHSWFTRGFAERGLYWTKRRYHYHNMQQPGTLWYHDHAMGLTRINLLAGLIGAYVIRHPKVELPLGLPSGDEFERTLVICDRDFYKDGSLYMNRTGNNPKIHPQWQPEYFGDVIVVNGKAWPYMEVQRRKYRFRIINTSNARFFRFYLTNGMPFIHIGSDSAYLGHPSRSKYNLVAPSEISDVVIDFANSKSGTDAQVSDPSRVPFKLIKYPLPDLLISSRTRYIAMHEYTSSTDEPTHLYINGMSFDEPVTETPKVGTSEVWYVINLTEDNHPLHIHLALFRTLEQVKLVDFDTFKDCMIKYDDAIKCDIDRHARGMKKCVPAHEKGWKNVFKMKPGYVTKIFVRFSYIHVNGSYPFDATAEPGYVYHCHDRTSRIVIGVGEQCDGLYYLRDFQDGHARANGFTSHDSIELWH